MDTSELLERIARSLREEVGPAIEADYEKTQAYLSAVVLQKVAAELRHAERHQAAGDTDRAELASDLGGMLSGRAPDPLLRACSQLQAEPTRERLSALIEAIYGTRDQLGPERFRALLDRVRVALRTELDRRMEYAR